MQAASRRLGEFLVERKVLSRDALEHMLERETQEGVPLSKILINEGLVGEKDLVAAVAHQVGIRFIDLSQTPVHPTVDRLVPAELARKYLAIAVELDGADLVVAMVDPSNREALAALESATGWPIRPAIAVRTEVKRLVSAMYGDVPEGKSAGGDLGADLGEISLPAGDGDMTIPAAVTADGPGEELHVNDLLQRVVDLGGSDLHLTVGIHPSVRVHGEIKALTEFPKLNGSEIRRMMYAILTQKQREKFETDLELDTSHSVPDVGRFRVNVFLQRDSVGAVMRTIPFEIVPLESLGLPASVKQFAELPRGLVLVTGPTGSGKSTSLASLVDIINVTKACHIMTVEDPIEFLHNHKMAVVNQREIGEDTHSFGQALKHVLRQDPDVIL